jgi:hypothetical protein
MELQMLQQRHSREFTEMRIYNPADCANYTKGTEK